MRKFHCDGPECGRYIETDQLVPPVFLTVSQIGAVYLHFCGWDCVLRFAGRIKPEVESP